MAAQDARPAPDGQAKRRRQVSKKTAAAGKPLDFRVHPAYPRRLPLPTPMKSLARLLVPAVLLACAATPLFAADAVELKQRWIAGKQYFQTMQSTQGTTIDLGAQKIEQKTSTTMEMSLAVRPHEDGTRKRVTIKYERVAMSMDMNGQKMGFDSAKPGEGTDPLGLAKTLGGTVGKELKVLLTATDDIGEVENYDEFVKNFPASPIPGMDMSKMFNKDSMAQMMKQGALQAMPGKPVVPGDSWPFTTSVDLPQMGKVAVKGTYTFKGLKEHGGVSCAEIATEGTIALDMAKADPSSPAGAALAQLGMKVEGGTLKGTVWFDPKLGFARDAQLVQEMNMTMKNPTDPKASIKVPLKQEISTTLTKVEDVK